jgi:type IV fimbrial biogenesis protein FimT
VQKGLSLPELLLTLALSAVLLQLSLPGFQDLMASQRASAASNGVIATVAMARSAAMVYRHNVVICPRNPAGVCGRKSHWSNGAIVFADTNNNRRYDQDEVRYGTLPAVESGATLVWRSFRNRSYLLFRPSGITDWQNGHFQYCPTDKNPHYARQIIINAAGRTRSARDSDADGIAENAQGAPLQCS